MYGVSTRDRKSCLTLPQELHNAVNDKEYKERLEELRARMIRHLSERGEEFVKDGRLVVRKKKMLYSPHYPKE